MLEKVVMADVPAEYAATVAQLEYYSRKDKLIHLIDLCDRRLKTNSGKNRIKFELMLYSYLTQLGLMEKPC